MKKILTIITTLAMGITLTIPAFAAENDELKEALKKAVTDGSISECQETLTPAFDLALQEFLVFLDENFKNKSSNSSLTNIAITRYDEYRGELNEVFAGLGPAYSSGNTNTNAAELSSYSNCTKIAESYKELAKAHMIRHIQNTSAQKQTTIMVEKYHALNNRLRELNFKMAQTYGLFMTFNQKLPGFLRECSKS